MANIDKELQAIQDAIYGEEVRSSIHDAIKAVNDSATDSALVCETKAKEALESAKIALEKALEILSTADASKSYAVGGTGTREGEDTDNAKYYMKQAQSAASGLIPSGNVTFEQLMALTDIVVGAMYHVTNEFTTNDKFEDYAALGAEEYPAGTNVYMKVDGLWCTMVGSEVIGVKGNEEESYRTGHVNITKENIGIINATIEKAGIVKLSDSSAVTDSTGLALPATEKNASIEGTLANQLDTLNSNLKSKVKTYSSIPTASDLKSAIAVFCALRNSADTFSSFQGLIPNMKTKYIDISTGSVVLKDITWSKTNGTITGDISSFEVRFVCIF